MTRFLFADIISKICIRFKTFLTFKSTATVNVTSGHIYVMAPNPKGTRYHGISNEDGYTYENVKFSDMNKGKVKKLIDI